MGFNECDGAAKNNCPFEEGISFGGILSADVTIVVTFLLDECVT